MTRHLTTAALLITLGMPCMAASGGPDAYGYTWKDQNEPDGPTFNWVDITSIGTQVTGLGDDNVVGPFVMQTNMPFYWYEVKNVWIGSNGYLAFNNGNIASPFQNIPNAGGVNDFIAAMLSDLNFSGAGNPGQCYIFDDPALTIISYINVPFWTQFAPSYTGSNTFQVLLNKVDGTITIQFLEQSGLTMNNNIVVGIESVAGSIGLEHSFNTYPTGSLAIRFDPPVVPLIDVTDAAVAWNTEVGSGGRSLALGAPAFALTTNIINLGSTDLQSFTVGAQVLNAQGQAVVTATPVTVGQLAPGVDTIITFAQSFNPAQAGTYRFIVNITGVAGDLVAPNNTLTQELRAYDISAPTNDLSWAGPNDDGLGIGWSGGNGGVAVQIIPPAYPAYATDVVLRIASNTGTAGFFVRVFDDDGPDGAPGTMLSEVSVPPAQATAGNKVIALPSPITIQSGSVYVQWYMQGEGINIATDVQPPFSYRTYEVLDNIWAAYRSILAQDFHLGLRLGQTPFRDLQCSGFFAPEEGATLSSPTTVRAFVRNNGNVPETSFTMNYRFGDGPVVSQAHTGAALQPGAQLLVNFSQQLLPQQDLTGQLCAWSSMEGDELPGNDTTCISVSTVTGIMDLTMAQVRLAPNPADDLLYLEGLPVGHIELRVHDARGALVLATRSNGGERSTMDVSMLRPGAYVLSLLHTHGMAHHRLVIAR